MFMNFSNFLLWEVYPSVVIHHEQCIFLTYDPAGRERNNFQQLIKINWTKIHFYNFTSITSKNKVTHQKISTCPKSFLVTLKFSFLFIMKSFFNVNFYTWRSAFISHVVYLGKTSNSWYKYSGPFLMPKILQYAQNSQCIQISIFPNGKHIFPNSLINS